MIGKIDSRKIRKQEWPIINNAVNRLIYVYPFAVSHWKYCKDLLNTFLFFENYSLNKHAVCFKDVERCLLLKGVQLNWKVLIEKCPKLTHLNIFYDIPNRAPYQSAANENFLKTAQMFLTIKHGMIERKHNKCIMILIVKLLNIFCP